MANNDLEKLKQLIFHPKLGEILVQHKKINIIQLTEALNEQEKTNFPLGQILIDKNFITQDDLIGLLSLQNNIDKLLIESYIELEKLKGESP
jgi:hypothetical protein